MKFVLHETEANFLLSWQKSRKRGLLHLSTQSNMEESQKDGFTSSARTEGTMAGSQDHGCTISAKIEDTLALEPEVLLTTPPGKEHKSPPGSSRRTKVAKSGETTPPPAGIREKGKRGGG